MGDISSSYVSRHLTICFMAIVKRSASVASRSLKRNVCSSAFLGTLEAVPSVVIPNSFCLHPQCRRVLNEDGRLGRSQRLAGLLRDLIGERIQ
jgi:hypothetical protein